MSVPAEVKEMYRALNPGATDAEIPAHYNAAIKRADEAKRGEKHNGFQDLFHRRQPRAGY